MSTSPAKDESPSVEAVKIATASLEGVTADSSPKPEKSPSGPKTKTPMNSVLIGVVVLVLLLCGVGYFFLSRGNVYKKTEKVYHIGILSALPYFDPIIDGFEQKMTELGYVEGKNITYDVQKGPAPVGNQKIVEKFVADKADLILAFPTEASLEAKEGTKGTNIPVISVASYIEGNGLIENIQHPGGNITGVRFPIVEVAAKRLELLHEIAPKAKRIWIPVLKDYPTVAPSLVVVKASAQTMGISIIDAPFTDPSEMAKYLKEKAPGLGIDAILLIPEPVSIIPPFAEQIDAYASSHNIPVAGVVVLNADHGPIFSLIPTGLEFGRLAAPLADKVFKGTPAGAIPVSTPENELSVNYKAIQKLGLTVSEGILSGATKIIR